MSQLSLDSKAVAAYEQGVADIRRAVAVGIRDAKLSQRKIADEIAVSRETVRRAATESPRISLRVILQLADFLGVPYHITNRPKGNIDARAPDELAALLQEPLSGDARFKAVDKPALLDIEEATGVDKDTLVRIREGETVAYETVFRVATLLGLGFDIKYEK